MHKQRIQNVPLQDKVRVVLATTTFLLYLLVDMLLDCVKTFQDFNTITSIASFTWLVDPNLILFTNPFELNELLIRFVPLIQLYAECFRNVVYKFVLAVVLKQIVE